MPASKATYANVFVNGNWNGLYTCVQSVDNDFTNEHFYERKGPLFKVDNTGVQVPNCVSGQHAIWKYYADTNCYQRAYEIQSTDDWAQLGNFLDTLNNYFTEKISKEVVAKYGSVDLIMANNVFAHISDINDATIAVNNDHAVNPH